MLMDVKTENSAVPYISDALCRISITSLITSTFESGTFNQTFRISISFRRIPFDGMDIKYSNGARTNFWYRHQFFVRLGGI